MKENNENIAHVSLLSLFWNFLKIGTYSFGGYMSLIAVVRKDFVERKNLIADEEVLNGLSLASFVPGPVAVNVIVFIGYFLRGIAGAVVSMIGVLLPTFLLVVGFSALYFHQDFAKTFDPHIAFVMPVIIAIIADVGIKMARKQTRFWIQRAIAASTLLVTFWIKSILVVPIVLVTTACLGFLLFRKKTGLQSERLASKKYLIRLFFPLITRLTLVGILVIILGIVAEGEFYKLVNLGTVFSGMSLTLFGGGYIIIPILENTVVNNLQWVSNNEFNMAISISQITPGPILISATFIGFKIAGFAGAVVATISIFLPSGILMMALSEIHKNIKESVAINAILTGLRSAVIGLIATATLSMGIKEIQDELGLAIFLISLSSFLWTKIHPAILILVTLSLSLIL